MFGLNLWRTKRSLINLSELTEEELTEAAKDVFPLGTIKQYGPKHLYVKVGGKKPWVYYATIGTDKSNDAIKAGGVAVADGKGMGAATPENLKKYGAKHPSEAGVPLPELPPLSAPATGATGGIASVEPPKATPKPKKPVKQWSFAHGFQGDFEQPEIDKEIDQKAKKAEPDPNLGDIELTAKQKEANDLSTAAYDLSTAAHTPEEHKAAAAAHSVAVAANIAAGNKEKAKEHADLAKAHQNVAEKPMLAAPESSSVKKAKELSQQAKELSANASTPEEHEAAKQAHLQAASAHDWVGNEEGKTEHLKKAQEHGEAADQALKAAHAEELSQKANELSVNAITGPEHKAAADAHTAAVAAHAEAGNPDEVAKHGTAALNHIKAKKKADKAQDDANELSMKAAEASTAANDADTAEAHQAAIEAHKAAYQAQIAANNPTSANEHLQHIADHSEAWSEADKKKAKKKHADELSKFANAASIDATTPEEHDVAVKAHIKAHNAYMELGDKAAALPHENAVVAHSEMKKQAIKAKDDEAKKKKKAGEGWESFPDPDAAEKLISAFMKEVDKAGNVDNLPLSLKTTAEAAFGPDWKKTLQLAKTVQSMSGYSSGNDADAGGIFWAAQKMPGMADKLNKLYGAGWEKKAKAIGTALAADNNLAPTITTPIDSPVINGPLGPVPAPGSKPTPTINDLANAMVLAQNAKSGPTASDALDKMVADYPELKDKLVQISGMHYKDAAFLASQLIDKGLEKTLAAYDDLSPEHKVQHAVKALAAAMGVKAPAEPVKAIPVDFGELPDEKPAVPSVKDVADAMNAAEDEGADDGGISVLNQMIADHPELKDKLTQAAGLPGAADHIAAALIAKQVSKHGLANTLKSYGHLDPSDPINKAVKNVAALLPSAGSAPLPSPAAAPPSGGTFPPHVATAVQDMANAMLANPASELGVMDSWFAKDPELKAALTVGKMSPKVAGIMAKKIVSDGVAATLAAHAPDGPLNTVIKHIAAGLGLSTGMAPVTPVAPSPPTSSAPENKTFQVSVKTPKKGQAYQAIKKLGYDHESKEAKVVALMHTFGDLKTVVKKMAGYGLAGDEVANLLDKVKNDAEKIGAISFTTGGEGTSALGTATFPPLKGSKKGAAAAAAPPPAPPPPPASAVPSELPSPSDLKLKGDAKSLGGAGEKHMYVDKTGKEYLFKVAASKSGNKVEMHRAEVQVAFSAVARMVKPNHPPVGVVTLGGKLGTLYPFVPAKGNLKGVAPSKLTDTEKFDVATEHILDWLGSQHDSHSANLLRTDDGRIIGIDKEQGFKYFPEDQLDVDYHPNSKYGENEPYYNTFWREWSEKKFDFDPRTLVEPIKKAMAIPGLDYANILKPYAGARSPGNAVKQAQFLRQAVNRKNTLRNDYEKFLSKLYAKREGTAGKFTFADGWIPESQANKPYKKTVIVTPEQHFPEKHHNAASLLSTLPGTSKTAEYVPKGASTPDPSKITVKTTASPEQLKDVLKTMGFGDVDVKIGGQYKMAFVDKAKWDAFDQIIPAHTIPAVTKEETVHPGTTITPHSGQATYFPAMRASDPTIGNVAALKKVTKSTRLHLGSRITLDGPAVEQQVGRVVRKKDSTGEYYEVHFKLRQTVKVDGGTSASYSFPTGEYDAAQDTVVNDGGTSTSVTAKKFQTSHGEAYYVPPGSAFSMQGSVYARIRSGPEHIHEALHEVLDKMKPGLADEVLRDPTPDEQEVVKLSAALKAVAPQVADKLDADELAGKETRTSDLLRKKLKGYMSDEDMASLGQVEILPNFAGVVLPGRWRKLGGTTDPKDPNVRFLMWEVSDEDKVVNMFKGNGPASIHDRLLQGLDSSGSSVSSDINTGCADNITMRMVTKSEDNKGLGQGWGNIRLIFAPDELDRLDPFFHHGDKYGCTDPNNSSYGASFRKRKTLDADITSQMGGAETGELVIRRGIPTDKVVRISCASETERKALIKKFKESDFNEINGCPVEDFVVVAGTRGEVYKKYVQPAGY